jgi:hypothetical protein
MEIVDNRCPAALAPGQFVDLSLMMRNPDYLKMKALIKELKHAFAVDPAAGDALVLPSVLERFAEEVVRRGMETPAILLLETARPLSFISSQVMFAVSPLMRALTRTDDIDKVAAALTDRRCVSLLVDRIETLSRCSEEDGGTP